MMARGKGKKKKFSKNMPMPPMDMPGMMMDMHTDSHITEPGGNGLVMNRKKKVNTYGMKNLKGE